MSFSAPRRLPWLLLISALVFIADRLTKIWVVAHVPIGDAIPIYDHILRISHWTNEGAAFSLFAGWASPHTVNHALTAVNFLVASGVLAALVFLGNRITLVTIALALILGGATGNVHDRIAYGAVVDFIEVHIYHYHWPDFNIADSSIVTGACLLFLDSLWPHKKTDA
ncbi:MAG: signal peptidase II [Terracidiphilus sp.]